MATSLSRRHFLRSSVAAGLVALRIGHDIEWDGQAMKSPGLPDADAFVKAQSRAFWTEIALKHDAYTRLEEFFSGPDYQFSSGLLGPVTVQKE